MAVSAAQLTPGKTVLVRGKIGFSRLARLIDGEELARSIEQARKRGALYPTDKPHRTITLNDPQIIGVPGSAPTLEQEYVQGQFYTSKSGKNAGHQAYSIDDKSPSAPVVLEMIPAGEAAPGATHRQLILERDLDSGLDVTLVLEVFQTGAYANRGIGIRTVVLNEPTRYYQAAGGIDPATAAALGITVDGPIQAVVAAPAAPAAPAVPAGTVVTQEGYALPGPGLPAAAAAPVQAAPAAAPVQAPQALTADEQAELAALRAQAAAAQAAATPQGQSAFDAAPAAGASPWEGDAPVPGIGMPSI